MQSTRSLIAVILIASASLSMTAQGTKCALVKDCEEKAKNATKSCYGFMTFLDKKCGGLSSTYCANYSRKLIRDCTSAFCKDCLQKAKIAHKECVKFYQSVPNMANKVETVCSVAKEHFQENCPRICKGLVGATKSNPGIDCKNILEMNSVPSGIYWIKPDGDATPVQAYCDMEFQGGGWTLASYGYVSTFGATDAGNKNIPNMNHPSGFNWHPTSRASSNGLIPLQHGAVKLAQGAQAMIMAAGNNPTQGGIDGYSHVYLIDISHNPYNITFANHNRFHGAIGVTNIPKMHVVEFKVSALKGDSGSAKRYALAEALGVTWSDSYPSGYGFSPNNQPYSTWSEGPFFPSVHSGDGHKSACSTAQSFPPDVQRGCPNYVHYGWYSLRSTKNTGQTSIWFK